MILNNKKNKKNDSLVCCSSIIVLCLCKIELLYNIVEHKNHAMLLYISTQGWLGAVGSTSDL